MKLDRDGKLGITEADVERCIREFLESEGWTYIETKAETVKRSGAPAHKRYTLDAVAIRCPKPWPGLTRPIGVIFLELKARRAKTKAARLKGQTDTAAELRRRGFLVYQAAEGDPQPIESFREWYGKNF